MSSFSIDKPYRVTLIESERGWGQKSEYVYFASKTEAEDYMTKINSYKTSEEVPDWYMVARDLVFAGDIINRNF